ncbi:hypothetical protein C4564_03455 [Candidatus Microgenomates bacterium]|nr:MAG: hypothetical protein C4564_03455 [Candidatus Microgenomates bacterium]
MKHRYLKTALMCPPEYFDVNYSINPWMQGKKVNQDIAHTQWMALKNTLGQLRVEICEITQNEALPDMVFAADQAVTRNKCALLSNFHYKERRQESYYYEDWFISKGYSVKHLPENMYFEGGGESVWVGEKLLIGTGFRTSSGACSQIAETLDVETHCIELIDPLFYHLDTCLFVLNEKCAFWYESAFSASAKEKLNKLIPNLLPLSKKEAFNFAGNSVVTDHTVIMQSGNTELKSKVQDLGYRAIDIDVSEFMKAGGGAHCLVGVLEEEYV